MHHRLTSNKKVSRVRNLRKRKTTPWIFIQIPGQATLVSLHCVVPTQVNTERASGQYSAIWLVNTQVIIFFWTSLLGTASRSKLSLTLQLPLPTGAVTKILIEMIPLNWKGLENQSDAISVRPRHVRLFSVSHRKSRLELICLGFAPNYVSSLILTLGMITSFNFWNTDTTRQLHLGEKISLVISEIFIIEISRKQDKVFLLLGSVQPTKKFRELKDL